VTTEAQGLAGPDGRYHFLLRRLHSLSGIIPIGVFLIFHLFINASTIFGADAFQSNVDRIHGLGGLLVPVEFIGIFIPIAFHAILGIQIWLTGQANTGAYAYASNWRYTLQRYTGIVALVFILFHLWHMHWTGSWIGGGWFDPHRAYDTAAAAMQRSALFTVVYVIGMLCAVYHFANGIWTFMITWGFAISDGAQRRMGYVCAIVGIALAVAGLTSLFALDTADVHHGIDSLVGTGQSVATELHGGY
jgi:succinate dehydrogenase / fumarate reductase cytochrome b subunit